MWVYFTNITLSKMSQTQKNKHCMNPFTKFENIPAKKAKCRAEE